MGYTKYGGGGMVVYVLWGGLGVFPSGIPTFNYQNVDQSVLCCMGSQS